MKNKTFNILLTTIGRPTLKRMIDSIYPQLLKDDYLTIVADCNLSEVLLQLNDCIKNAVCTINIIQNSEMLGFFGHGSRNKWQDSLLGDYLLHGDDDDVYTSDAMDIIRQHCTESKLYIFKMLYNFTEMPRTPVIEFGNIGTPCGVIPNKKCCFFPIWELEYGGDFKFYKAVSECMDFEFIDKVIYRIRES